MKVVRRVACPKDDYGTPEMEEDVPRETGLVRNCAVCDFYEGESDTHVFCSYPSLKLEIYYQDELMYSGDSPFEEEAIIVVNEIGRG